MGSYRSHLPYDAVSLLRAGKFFYVFHHIRFDVLSHSLNACFTLSLIDKYSKLSKLLLNLFPSLWLTCRFDSHTKAIIISLCMDLFFPHILICKYHLPFFLPFNIFQLLLLIMFHLLLAEYNSYQGIIFNVSINIIL